MGLQDLPSLYRNASAKINNLIDAPETKFGVDLSVPLHQLSQKQGFIEDFSQFPAVGLSKHVYGALNQVLTIFKITVK